VSTVAELTLTRPFPQRRGLKGTFAYRVVTTTDPKLLGMMYTVTSIGFFMVGGLMALFMRTELAAPGLQFFSNEQYNQLFTMHGTIMLLLYATPIVFGFANCILPLQIGAPDVAFPRLNAQLLAVPVRRAGHCVRFPHPRRCRGLRLDGIHAPEQRHPLPGRWR
jgi:cytochrome c oxidase subunit 1